MIRTLLALITLPLATGFLQGQNPPGPEKVYSIAGRVKQPGAYPLTKPTTVLEAINAAGGVSDSEPMEVFVTLGGGKGSIVFMLHAEVKALQFQLHDGDVITMKPSGKLDHIRLPAPP